MERKQKIHQLIKDIIIISIGLFISSIGTAVFYEAGMGSGAMATFSDGVHRLLNISYGQANIVMNVIFLVVLFLCNKKYINVGTVLCVFLIGVFVDMGTALFAAFPIGNAPWIVRLLEALLGTVMMGVGLGLYVAVDRGFGALEGLVKVFVAKTGWEFGKVKIVQDVLLIAGGVILHAAWGIGTLISAVLIGPIMQVSIKYFQKLLKKAPAQTGRPVKVNINPVRDAIDNKKGTIKFKEENL